MREIILRFIILLTLFFSMSGLSEASIAPERRKSQFQTESGYYIFPTPYSLPGIGDGLALIGTATNIMNTYTDVYGFALIGDLEGVGAAVADIHIIPKTLILDLDAENLGAATITNYSQRGMNTNKHDFTLLDVSAINFYGARLISTFLDRRFEIYGAGYAFGSKLERVRNENGEVILDAENSAKVRARVYALGARLDITDDYADPRKGFRFDVSRWSSPPEDSTSPDYYNMQYNTSVYIPIGRRSTWAFNYFRSDAHVVRKGETDRAVIANEQGLDCESLTDPHEQAQCQQIIDNIIAANTFGSSSSLGGRTRLRSFPEDRYRGAHTVFYGTEIRWNLTEEFTPFNIYIMKDIRTSMQVAVFYELGSVADIRSDLGDVMRSSYGAGFRMVTASGIVFRADVASGREGVETTIIIGYPWEGF